MSLAVAAFTFCFLAGFVIRRLARDKPLLTWEHKLLRPLGWILMAASISFGGALIGWVLVHQVRG